MVLRPIRCERLHSNRLSRQLRSQRMLVSRPLEAGCRLQAVHAIAQMFSILSAWASPTHRRRIARA